MSYSLGTDISGITGLDSALSIASEGTCLAQAICRRWITPNGGLWYDPDYGTDMRQWIRRAPVIPSRIAQALRREALKDERVEDCLLKVEFDSLTQSLTIRAQVVTQVGPFDFTFTVSATSVSLLMPKGT